jgi:hypothetical protein
MFLTWIEGDFVSACIPWLEARGRAFNDHPLYEPESHFVSENKFYRMGDMGTGEEEQYALGRTMIITGRGFSIRRSCLATIFTRTVISPI